MTSVTTKDGVQILYKDWQGRTRRREGEKDQHEVDRGWMCPSWAERAAALALADPERVTDP